MKFFLLILFCFISCSNPQVDQSIAINIYPNPYNGQLLGRNDKVEIINLPEVYLMTIYNSLGVVVQTFEANNVSHIQQWTLIDINGFYLEADIYKIKVVSSELTDDIWLNFYLKKKYVMPLRQY